MLDYHGDGKQLIVFIHHVQILYTKSVDIGEIKSLKISQYKISEFWNPA